MGASYPRLTSSEELDIWIRFQYRCYSKQDSPPNRVKPIPLKALLHISSMDTASGDPLLMTEIDMIIIAYFFLLRPGEYTVSKSENTPLCLKDTAFTCSQSVFATTSTEGNLQAANFVTLKFMTQKNGIRGGV